MAAAAGRKKPRREVPGNEPVRAAEQAMTSKTPPAGGPAATAAWLRLRGLSADIQPVPEKEKISITLDKPLVDEIRAQFSGRPLSASINELLYAALAQERLGELVDEMERETGPVPPEAYERVLAQWFAHD